MPADPRPLLLGIERELQALSWWEPVAPPPRALASTQPFCIDTLSFPQWLQFVLLPRLHQMLHAGQTLPNRIAVYPMATECFKGVNENPARLLEAIAQLDEALTGQPVEREA